MAIEIVANAQHAAVMIHHDLVRIHLFRGEAARGAGDPEQIAPDPVAGSHEDAVVMEDGSGDGGRAALPRRAP